MMDNVENPRNSETFVSVFIVLYTVRTITTTGRECNFAMAMTRLHERHWGKSLKMAAVLWDRRHDMVHLTLFVIWSGVRMRRIRQTGKVAFTGRTRMLPECCQRTPKQSL